jgi:hypothetical protein
MGSRTLTCLLAVLLPGVTGCMRSHQLETRLGGRPLEELRAQAHRAEGQWQVELLLPMGHWQVETSEGQSFTLVPNEPRATLRWTVAPDRWSQQNRPFHFDLVGESGLRLSFSVVYPNSLPGQNLVLEVFRVLSGRT